MGVKVKCDCGEEGNEPHSCPYAEDVHDDPESLCACCDHCTQQCAVDI